MPNKTKETDLNGINGFEIIKAVAREMEKLDNRCPDVLRFMGSKWQILQNIEEFISDNEQAIIQEYKENEEAKKCQFCGANLLYIDEKFICNNLGCKSHDEATNE